MEKKLGMGHYDHKSILDAKVESGSSSSFGDMTSQNFPRKEERTIYPRKTGLTLKNELLCPESFLSTQN